MQILLVQSGFDQPRIQEPQSVFQIRATLELFLPARLCVTFRSMTGLWEDREKERKKERGRERQKLTRYLMG